MRTGDLNKFIDIQAETRTSDGMGGYTVVFTTVASNVYAAIWPVSAKDIVRDMQNIGVITHRVRIRYLRVLRSSWRIKFGDAYFAIVGPPIDPNMKHEYLDIMCKQVTK
jgi:SPP1 family predicted phage head-tail adaptor